MALVYRYFHAKNKWPWRRKVSCACRKQGVKSLLRLWFHILMIFLLLYWKNDLMFRWGYYSLLRQDTVRIERKSSSIKVISKPHSPPLSPLNHILVLIYLSTGSAPCSYAVRAALWDGWWAEDVAFSILPQRTVPPVFPSYNGAGQQTACTVGECKVKTKFVYKFDENIYYSCITMRRRHDIRML